MNLEITNRPDTIDAGTASLVITYTHLNTNAALELLDQQEMCDSMPKAQNPFREDQASSRNFDDLGKHFDN